MQDPDRSIAIAYGVTGREEERYVAEGSGGRRPAVIIDESGLVLRALPDLATVEQQIEALEGLA